MLDLQDSTVKGVHGIRCRDYQSYSVAAIGLQVAEDQVYVLALYGVDNHVSTLKPGMSYQCRMLQATPQLTAYYVPFAKVTL